MFKQQFVHLRTITRQQNKYYYMEQVKGQETQEQNGYSLKNQRYQQLYDYAKAIKWVVQTSLSNETK